MARITGTVEGRVHPDRNMVLVIGTGFLDMFLPDFTQNRRCYGGEDLLYVMSDGRTGHDEHVVLEAWDGPPGPVEAEISDTTRITLTRPGIYVSRMTESAASPVLELPEAGAYAVRVIVGGRPQPASPVAGARPVEHVRVQLWPATRGDAER
jgi:hypothetical protein